MIICYAFIFTICNVVLVILYYQHYNKLNRAGGGYNMQIFEQLKTARNVLFEIINSFSKEIYSLS